MIARSVLPDAYRAWNRRWHAPYGRGLWLPARLSNPLTARFPRLAGPFGFQANNTTRTFEYPWAYFAAPLSEGMNVVEIGGALSGFQFVAAREGARVTNVDPAEGNFGSRFPINQASIDRLNAAFGTSVRHIAVPVEQAGFEPGSVDRIYSISTIEHIPPAHLPALMAAVHRALAPGGKLVLTVDLFFDLSPFTSAISNRFGTNVAPYDLIQMSDLELVDAEPAELLGFEEFDPDRVRADLDQYFVGLHDTLAQCFVLAKRQ